MRTRRVFHTVRAGDTMYSVAKRYGVAVEDLQRWNAVDKIRPGQKLAVEVRAPTKRAKGKPRAQPKGKVYKKADR
jgi:membrane-bound lytic murein transglycosylase D